MIIVFAFALITLATGMYARVIVNLTVRHYSERAENLAGTIAAFIDVDDVIAIKENVKTVYDSVDNKVFSERWGEDDWNEYISNFAGIENSEEFSRLHKTLREYQNINGADCVYLSYVDPKSEAFIYLVDADSEEPCPPGCIDVIYDVNREVLTNPERGFPTYTTNTAEYGHLITTGKPIFRNGEVIAFAMIDYSYETVRSEQAINVWKLYSYLVLTSAILCIITLIIIQKTTVKPIKLLTDASRRFAQTKSKADESAFSDLKIKTHDELEELAEAMKDMEVQVNTNMKELIEMNEKLTTTQHTASEMSKLANLDALTGVGNNMSYDNYVKKIEEDIQNGNLKKFGVAMIDLNSLKQINDEHGHNTGNEAIIKLSQMVRETFAHSPVYRIGGDEFVVILQGADYDNSALLIEHFNSVMQANSSDPSLPVKDRIIAALGYSEFNSETDKCYDDVFIRADNDMYTKKNEMKNNKPTE